VEGSWAIVGLRKNVDKLLLYTASPPSSVPSSVCVLYSIHSSLNPNRVLGPIAGAWIAEKTTWHWVFWSSSILCGIIQAFGFLFLQESVFMGLNSVRGLNMTSFVQRSHQCSWNGKPDRFAPKWVSVPMTIIGSVRNMRHQIESKLHRSKSFMYHVGLTGY